MLTYRLIFGMLGAVTPGVAMEPPPAVAGAPADVIQGLGPAFGETTLTKELLSEAIERRMVG